MSGDADDAAADRASGAGSALRDSAKWMVGGVVATAATVFAGSSLTKFGSLGLADHPERLAAAIGGLGLGFLGLGLILFPAIALLTIDTLTFRILATNPDLEALRLTTESRFPVRPMKNARLANLAGAFDLPATSDDDKAEIAAFAAIVVPDATFQSVREKFVRLTKALKYGTVFAIIGFGTFAWAANPAEEKPKPPTPKMSMTITVG